MRRTLLAVGVVLMAGSAWAQEPPDLPTCYTADPLGTVRRLALAGGVVAELSRVQWLDPDAGDCHLTVTDASGQIVLDRGGFNVRVMPATGQDLDGDGAPDAVFGVDTAGGNHCCWDTTIVSLKAPARVSAESEAALGFLFDQARRRYVAEEVLAFYELGPDMASSPTAIRFHRIGANGFEDVTRDYCADLFDPLGRGPFSRDDDRGLLTADARAASRASRGDRFRNEQVRLAAISLALQAHVCGRPTQADALIDDVFPPALATTTRQRVSDAVESYRQK